jgi:hypothetical protein
VDSGDDALWLHPRVIQHSTPLGLVAELLYQRGRTVGPSFDWRRCIAPVKRCVLSCNASERSLPVVVEIVERQLMRFPVGTDREARRDRQLRRLVKGV